jgi:hypothetical protein
MAEARITGGLDVAREVRASAGQTGAGAQRQASHAVPTPHAAPCSAQAADAGSQRAPARPAGGAPDDLTADAAWVMSSFKASRAGRAGRSCVRAIVSRARTEPPTEPPADRAVHP